MHHWGDPADNRYLVIHEPSLTIRAEADRFRAEIEGIRAEMQQIHEALGRLIDVLQAHLMPPPTPPRPPRRRLSGLKSAIARSGLTQRAVARAVGMSEARLSNAVNGCATLDDQERRAIDAVLVGEAPPAAVPEYG
jgi:hypothetical protein